ncbi:MAG: glycosyltransferase [Candidatus Shapirobacteria bacterium]|jgi:glycosyltransferase involved in cell wall biosynthesis
MKIAVFHNLYTGGALNYMNNLVKCLSIQNSVDIYSFQKTTPINIKNVKYYTYDLNKTNNLFQHLFQVLVELRIKNKIIAEKINSSSNYDLVLIFPCLITQSPFLLRYIDQKKIKTIYFFMESKREFYEKTTYDHWSLKRIIARIIRCPIKLIDLSNCKKSNIIVSLSCYSSNLLKKVYKKKSFVIHPGLINIKPKTKFKNNNQQFISVGLLSAIKGHDFSIQQTTKNNCNLLIIGRENKNEIIPTNSSNTKIIHTENNKLVYKLTKKATFFLANQINEPFGISTLEASSLNTFVLGKNEGGTPEIVRHGLNGFLYPSNLPLAIKITNKFKNIKQLRYQKTCKISWSKTTHNLLTLYHHLKNEPTE